MLLVFEADEISSWNCCSLHHKSAESLNNLGYSASNACLIWDDSENITHLFLSTFLIYFMLYSWKTAEYHLLLY
jgi:hypothetical protein